MAVQVPEQIIAEEKIMLKNDLNIYSALIEQEEDEEETKNGCSKKEIECSIDSMSAPKISW